MSDAATATGLYAQESLTPGDVLAGRFRIERLLGIGGMGLVYLAHDQALGIDVAVKLLRPELAQRPQAFARFRQELLLARQVSSPHVVRIHDLAEHAGRWLISMDYVDGESLEARLQREERLDVDTALRIAGDIARGLQAAHARGVVHRDLKPANILLQRGGDALISDFGVACSMASSGLGATLGNVIGTPAYLSPEQARGDALDPRSDLYALGLILYEMLAGQVPFAGGTLSETLAQRMLREPPPVDRLRADVPGWLVRLLQRLLRPQPRDRLQHAGEVIVAIERRQLPRDRRRWRRVGLGLAATLAGVALLGVGAWQWQAQRASAPPPVVAAQPLPRLLVLPLAGEPGNAEQRLALGAWLRGSLGETLTVVDDARTRQALRQYDPTGQAPLDVAALRRLASAQRVLQPSLQRQGAGWRLQALLHPASGAAQRLDGPVATDPAAAYAAWLPIASRALLGEGATLPDDLPAPAALQAYARGLAAQQRDDSAQALQQFASASAQAPQSAPLRLAEVVAAQAIGEEQKAREALSARAPTATARPHTLAMLEALRLEAEDDLAAADRTWQALATARPDDSVVQLQFARVQAQAGHLDAARDRLRALSQRDPDDPRLWLALGKLAILSGNAATAVDDDLLRAQLLFRRGRDLYGEAETVNALGVGYGRLGLAQQAQAQYLRAVELRRQVGNRRGVATSLRNLAGTLSIGGAFAEAEQQLRQAQALYVELGDRDGQAAAANELGLLAEERGDYPQALQAFRGALTAWRALGDAHGVAETLNNIGFAHFQLGDLDSAQAFWEQAARAYADLNDATGRVRTAQNLGLLATARGQWAQAQTLLTQALREAERHQMLEEVAVSRRNLAELAFWQGQRDVALTELDQAQRLFQQSRDQRGQTDIALLRAQLWLALDDPAQARLALQQVQRQAAASVSSEQRAGAALLQAQLAERDGDDAAAAAALRQAEALARASGTRLLQLQVRVQAAHDEPALAALEADVARLGNAGLRLRYLQQALRYGAADQVAARYAQLQTLLLRGSPLFAVALHTQAAQRLDALGEHAAAQRARRAAAQAAGDADVASARSTP
ncbi:MULTISPECIES: serine/threonine-protein kinase [unclassified Xanthomonas]|uniref:serine/threonine-protein kinase n=1 Tax=Xanthomonas sp. LMG 9002 TaxID=1591158 RepID=UPI00136F1AD6|nr:serine/threonine-protein kinase [Xanthomonas sp. LMG 9002]MXV07318.1 tetratricopeptide repeat protein [Xanthomonas sp. LMG 9002]